MHSELSVIDRNHWIGIENGAVSGSGASWLLHQIHWSAGWKIIETKDSSNIKTSKAAANFKMGGRPFHHRDEAAGPLNLLPLSSSQRASFCSRKAPIDHIDPSLWAAYQAPVVGPPPRASVADGYNIPYIHSAAAPCGPVIACFCLRSLLPGYSQASFAVFRAMAQMKAFLHHGLFQGIRSRRPLDEPESSQNNLEKLHANQRMRSSHFQP